MTKQVIEMNRSKTERAEVGQVTWLDEEIAEISLLLPGWQAAQLVSLATSQRATVGQFLRWLIRKHLDQRSNENNLPQNTHFRKADTRQESELQAV
jgi:hypothetical protein